MSTDPVRDADDYNEAQAARSERIDSHEKDARAEIFYTLTKGIRLVSPYSLTLPGTDAAGRVVRVGLDETISDRVSYDFPFAALMTVLHRSDCEYVEALRVALAKDYADSEADAIGMALGDEL